MPNLAHQPRPFSLSHVVSGPRHVFGPDVLGEVLQVKWPIRPAHQVALATANDEPVALLSIVWPSLATLEPIPVESVGESRIQVMLTASGQEYPLKLADLLWHAP